MIQTAIRDYVLRSVKLCLTRFHHRYASHRLRLYICEDICQSVSVRSNAASVFIHIVRDIFVQKRGPHVSLERKIVCVNVWSCLSVRGCVIKTSDVSLRNELHAEAWKQVSLCFRFWSVRTKFWIQKHRSERDKQTSSRFNS